MAIRSFDREIPVKLAVELLQIPGESGRERPVVDYAVEALQSAGVPWDRILIDEAHERVKFGGEVGNVIVDFPGTISGPRRVLMAHMDTVPLCVGSMPVQVGERFRSANPATGVGADDRAGVAVILATAIDIVTCGRDHPPITFLLTVAEEIGMCGVRGLSLEDLYGPAFAFNFDGGSASKVTIGASGKERVLISIQGVSAHAGVRPENGANAITVAGLAIAHLHHSGLLGAFEINGTPASSNLGIVRGGCAINVVPDYVTIEGEIRSDCPAARDAVFSAVSAAFNDAAGEVRNRHGQSALASVSRLLVYESYRLCPDSEPVRRALLAIEQESLVPVPAVTAGGIDANWMVKLGIPTVSLGCGQENSHTTDETLNLVEFRRACRIALTLATSP